ncbi:hypothetical protein M758_1G305500 [Ceratodon purpureus]|uniref:Uncharacterized protein n=1 Tax=Ceratodon purpureus TaxID=3225 RepID=A0A8T0JBN7_CERPU|nr:hypothetical protein KC19_1G311700 [Ceratodon purpureus]KAG0632122.1 hypothetical protein M758_1G305500 [Ceratodon purpureus]
MILKTKTMLLLFILKSIPKSYIVETILASPASSLGRWTTPNRCREPTRNLHSAQA